MSNINVRLFYLCFGEARALPVFCRMLSIILFLNALVSSQVEGCESTNLSPCLESMALFKESTCVPLMATNATHYADCLCLNAIDTGNCYLQCDSPAAKAQFAGSAQPQITALCQAANIDPKGPRPKPSWQTSPTTTKPPTAATENPKSNGASVSESITLFAIAVASLLF
jgi:hypothetical protein